MASVVIEAESGRRAERRQAWYSPLPGGVFVRRGTWTKSKTRRPGTGLERPSRVPCAKGGVRESPGIQLEGAGTGFQVGILEPATAVGGMGCRLSGLPPNIHTGEVTVDTLFGVPEGKLCLLDQLD